MLLGEHQSKIDFLEQARKALSQSGRLDTIDVNPGLIAVQTENIALKKRGWIFNGPEYEGEKGIINPLFGVNTMEIRNFDKTNPNIKKAKEFFELYKENGRFGMEAVSEAFGEDGMLSMSEDYNGNKMISAKRMYEVLREEDWKKLIDIFYELKMEEVVALVDIFREPENFKTLWRGETETVKNYFIEEISRQN